MPTRLPVPVLAGVITAAVTSAVVSATLTSTRNWEEGAAAVAGTAASAAGTDAASAEPGVSGNALCFDTCRQLTATYTVDTNAEQTTRRAAAGLRTSGYGHVVRDCESNPWCTVTADRHDYSLTLSQYRDDAPYGLRERRTLTVTVGDRTE